MKGWQSAAIAFVGLATMLAPSRAEAFFEVCNRTGFSVDVAIAYHDRGDWVSIGWFQIPGRSCQQILTDILNNQYFYLFAEQVDGSIIWEGDYQFCVTDDAFEIVGAQTCRHHGNYQIGFFEVDVGTSKTWTTELVE